jgi:predicted dehydrogenase
MEAGVHMLDLLRVLAGGRPARVYTQAWPTPGSVFTGRASLLTCFETDTGVHAALEGSWTAPASVNTWGREYLRADMPAGSLVLDQQRLTLRTGHPTPDSRPHPAHPDVHDTPLPMPRPGPPHPSGTHVLLDAFADWVRGRRADHPTDLHDNIQCMALLFAARASADQRQAIDVQAVLAEARQRGRQAGPGRSASD